LTATGSAARAAQHTQRHGAPLLERCVLEDRGSHGVEQIVQTDAQRGRELVQVFDLKVETLELGRDLRVGVPYCVIGGLIHDWK
jgi:hypothetical protein